MTTLKIKLGDKTYMSGKITMYHTREALKLQRDSLALAKKAEAIQSAGTDVDSADELLSAMFDLVDRKSLLVCEVYGQKFAVDELEQSLTNVEIDAAVTQIISSVSGAIAKN
jgi:multidrug resistance efflux pump